VRASTAAGAVDLREILVTSTLLGDAAWEDEVLDDLVAELVPVVVRGGEEVVREGDPSDGLFVVASGRLRVVDAAGDAVAEAGRGDTVGELGLITGDPRTATVYAIRDSVLARLDREGYERLCRRHPEAMIGRFAGGMLRRLAAEARGERRPSTGFSGAIAVVAAAADVALGPLADELARQLALLGTTFAVAEDAVPDAEGEAAVARWLDEREREHRFLLYRAEEPAGAWRERCVRQADHVLVVARAADTPVATASLATTVRRRTSLVLLHDDAAIEPGAAALWREHVGADAVHHVRGGSTEDVARLARLVAGEATALVVGGGGARALAAAGVVRALAEAGLPVDVVVGVSAGAVVGALLTLGLSPDELVDRCARVARRVDYTVPVHALTSGRNWSASLGDLLGDRHIEDLPLPFACTSVNLSTAELVVHDRGPLVHAVRASSAIPGILPPVWDEGDLLVDGGLMNNLPVDCARALPGVGRVLAVDVRPRRRSRADDSFGYHVSGWRSLARLVLRRPAPLPSTFSLLMQSMQVSDAGVQRACAELADWIFRPPLGSFGLMQWDAFATIADAGYRCAVEALADPDTRRRVLA
jgi:predicted acylesterase/phospholipase RssA/CRP-like cAMP-binding protein